MRPSYRPSDYHGNSERDSIRKVPILRPQQIQKLDHLKKVVNNPTGNRARESYRPSRGSIRPSRSLKATNKHANHHEVQKKGYEKDREESSGLTKQLTLRSNEKSEGNRRRLTRAIQQQEQQGIMDKCCGLFKKEQKTIESPFKAAREASFRK